MARDRETPVSGLGERTNRIAKLGASDTPPRKVPCRVCGELVLMSGSAVDCWQAMNTLARKRRQPELREDEVMRCGASACRDHEGAR